MFVVARGKLFISIKGIIPFWLARGKAVSPGRALRAALLGLPRKNGHRNCVIH
jgi:hypothetical protein